MPSTSTLLLLLGATVIYGVFAAVRGLRANIAAAKSTGLPYVVAPVSPFNGLWQLTCKIWTPLIKLLPKSYWDPWLDILQPDWAYRFLRRPWQRLGDTFLLATAGQLILFTSDAHAIHQITARREAFPKQTSTYAILAIFGNNMIVTEGAEWKMHRKGVSASFNERNAAHIFMESIRQTQGMVEHWMGNVDDGEEEGKHRSSSGTITTLEHDTMTLALNIIAHVGFGLRLLWPAQTMPADIDARSKKYGSRDPPRGHSLTFADSVALVLEKIILLLLIPPSLLRVLPFKATRTAYAARWNYEKYMQELMHDKMEDAQIGDGDDEGQGGMDIMGQLVRTRYNRGRKTGKRADDAAPQLSDSDIIGNSFVILLAGHETTANTMHFTLAELAINPAAQRALQADVDRLLGRDSDPLTWNYERDINALMASHVAACMNEVLRLTPSVADIPKEVQPRSSRGQTLTVDGEQHVLPPGTTIILNTVGAHRNPKYWPTTTKASSSSSSSSAIENNGDLDDFVPERWFRTSLTRGATADNSNEDDDEDYGGFQGPDTSAQLYRPMRGSFIPFSDGPRSCLGRRIAQVEMVAALAVLFQRYSVELAVDEWVGSDEEVEALGEEARREVYEQARARARATMRQASSLLTLKLHGELKVPVRLVRRGEERFVGLVDS